MPLTEANPADLAAYREWQIPLARQDAGIGIRVYSGSNAARMPGFLFLHGGLFNCGTIEDGDLICKALVGTAVVISIDYPIAPQAVFPKAIEAIYSVLEWVASHARQFNIDPTRLFIGGHQAGGNMAIAVAMMSRDRLFNKARKRKLIGQILISPLLDPMLSSYVQADTEESRYRRGWHDYLSKPSDFQHPYAAPFWARRLLNLPKTLLITTRGDPLHGETSQFADRLCSSGIESQLSIDQNGNCPDCSTVGANLVKHVPTIHSFLSYS